MSQQQQVNLSDLDLTSLQQVKSQLEEELNHLTQSYSKLKNVRAKFNDCAEIYLYVPGKLSDVNKVIVDVGTGYYVEKSTENASKFYKDKVEYVKKNMGTLEETITSKQSSLRAILNVMQDKIQEQQQKK
ncbi:prefoldin, alpha subunit [Backusella circina FSU 941]|nr:prefoldin, alpha subunit [Backusella circina FSU 941]